MFIGYPICSDNKRRECPSFLCFLFPATESSAFFSLEKCNLGSRGHFLALGNAIWGPAGIF